MYPVTYIQSHAWPTHGDTCCQCGATYREAVDREHRHRENQRLQELLERTGAGAKVCSKCQQFSRVEVYDCRYIARCQRCGNIDELA